MIFFWEQKLKRRCDNLQSLYLCVFVADVRERLPLRHEKKSIPFQLLLAATNHFHESNVVGEGGFGKVYKGTNTNGDIWAVKRSKYVSREVKMEFEVEVSKCTLYLKAVGSTLNHSDGRGE